MMQPGEKSEENGRGDSTAIDHHDRDANGNNESEALLIPSGGDNSNDHHATYTKKRSVHGSGVNRRSSSDVLLSSTSVSSSSSTHRMSQQLNGGGGNSSPEGNNLIKYGALFLLVAQMVGLVLLMRYSRTQPRDPDQPLYLASTAVFAMEVMKLVMCLMVIAVQTRGNLLHELKVHVLQSPMEVLKLCVPSLLYTVQNNLLYLALTNLDAATYQVCYQLKILTTALFSAVLLHRKFSALKWLSLVILTVGVAIVQISGSGEGSGSHHHDNDAAGADHQHKQLLEAAASKSQEETAAAVTDSQNRFVGLLAVLFAACTSGFAGVWFEKILKGSRTSLWVRNVQMGLPSTVIAYVTVFAKDAGAVHASGFLQGYNRVVWTVVAVQAVGGLVVAVVVKYADNVLKVFATSFSIVVSCVISAVLFDFRPNAAFVLGAGLVVAATVMYSAPEPKRRARKTILPLSSTKSRP
jgi:solute carrier family 35 (UDP-sugar transporter), member A1/2/3